MNATLGSWDPMTQAQRSTRRAITAGIAILAVIATAIVIGITLWPNDSSPSGGAGKGPDLTWQSTPTGVEIPVSRSAGPRRQTNGLASGFARSELGAALAALHIAGRAAGSFGPAVFEPTIRNQVVGNDADVMLARVGRDYEEQRNKLGLAQGQPIPSSGGEILGYRIEDFTQDKAVVTTISGFGTDAEKFFGLRLEVQWRDGDWRLVAPPEGSIANAFQEFPTIPEGSKLFKRKS